MLIIMNIAHAPAQIASLSSQAMRGRQLVGSSWIILSKLNKQQNLQNHGALSWVLELNFNKKIIASIFAIISQTFR